MKTGDFDPKRARAKRPLPIWVDALTRDTMHLTSEEMGALFLLLTAMWGTKDCNFPDDPKRLATVTRVPLRTWKTRIGPVLTPLFKVNDGFWISKKLKEQADFVERHLSKQSHRSRSQNLGKSLKEDEVPSSMDIPVDEPGTYPTQQPNNPIKEEESIASSSFQVEAYKEYLKAHPKPHDSEAGKRAFRALVNDGVSEANIIGAARGYAEQVKGWSVNAKVQRSDNFLDPERGKWHGYVPVKPGAKTSEIDAVAFWAEKINAGKFIAPSAISSALGKEIAASGMVDAKGLKRANIR